MQQQQHQQQQHLLLRSYEIVMQAYLLRGRLRWFNDDYDKEESILSFGLESQSTTTNTSTSTNNNNCNPIATDVTRTDTNSTITTRTNLQDLEKQQQQDDDTIDILFFNRENNNNNNKHHLHDPLQQQEQQQQQKSLSSSIFHMKNRHLPTTTVVCVADVLDDLYKQWQWDQFQFLQQMSTTTSNTNNNNRNNNQTTIQETIDENDNNTYKRNNDDNNDIPLWNPISACWLASQALCATPRGGGQRNYAQRALDFVHLLLQQQEPNNVALTVPIEALLYGIHAAAWQQGSSSTTTRKGRYEKRRRDFQRNNVEEDEDEEDDNDVDDDDYHNDDGDNNNDDWAPQAYELWKELITILQPLELIHTMINQYYNNNTNSNNNMRTFKTNTMIKNKYKKSLSFYAYQPTIFHSYYYGKKNDYENDRSNNDQITQQQQQDLQQTLDDTMTIVSTILELCYLASSWMIEAWSKSTIPNSAQKANEILNYMIVWNQLFLNATNQQEQQQQSSPLLLTRRRIDTEVYTNVIMAYCKEGKPNHAYILLNEMIHYYCHQRTKQQQNIQTDDDKVQQQQQNPIILPTIAFNSVIAAWGKIGNTTMAIQVLQQMNQLSQRYQNQQQIQSSSSSSSTTKTIEQRNSKGRKWIGVVAEPNTISYNTILSSLYQQSSNHNNNNRNINNRYNDNKNNEMLLSNAKIAIALVRYMEKNYDVQPSIQPNAFTYHTLIRILLISIKAVTTNNNNKSKPFQRRARTTTTSKEQDTCISMLLQRIHLTLQKLDRLWRFGGNDISIEPSNRIYNMIINMYAKSNHRFIRQDAIRIVYELIEQMKQSKQQSMQPDIVTYTSLMECLSKHNTPIQTSSSTTTSSSSTTTTDHSSTLTSTSQQVMDLVDQVIVNYKTTKRRELRPNVRFFTMAIRTLSLHYGTIQQARSVLRKFIDLYEESCMNDDDDDSNIGDDDKDDMIPTAYPYNYVLNCAANSIIISTKEDDDDDGNKQKQIIFQLAAKTYQEIRHSSYSTVQPDSYTYGFWMKCCNNLLNKNQFKQAMIHEQCIRYAFEECKNCGLVTKEIITRLYQGCSTKLINELLFDTKNNNISNKDDHDNHNKSTLSATSSSKFSYQRIPQISELPASWSRNIANNNRKETKESK